MKLKIRKGQIHPEVRNVPLFTKIIDLFPVTKLGFRIYNKPGLSAKGKQIKGLYNEERFIRSNNGGADIRLRIYKPENTTTKLPVMLYLHGGGYALGCPEQSAAVFFKRFIEKRPCIIVAPDYRKSLDHPYPAAFNDCYDTLLWVNENTNLLNAQKGKIMVVGHSAGGGLTAAVTLKARDTQDVKIAFQMPIYPMIDDRQTSESSQFLSPGWDVRKNAKGWKYYLQDLKKQKAEIPTYAAPARNEDYSNFPPTITFVGDLDPFRDETIQYVEGLKKFNIPVEFKRYKGCYHGFEIMFPKSEIVVSFYTSAQVF